MSAHSLPELIREVNYLSKSYAESTTRLSDLIQEFEAMLGGLEGKIETTIRSGGVVLSFRRIGDRWGLFYQASIALPPQPLTGAPVAAKMDAVPLFGELLEQMVLQHRGKRDGLLSAIRTVEGLLGRDGKEAQ